MQNYWKAIFATDLTDATIADHVQHGQRTPNVSSPMHPRPMNGAAQRVGADETALGHRDKVIGGIWPDRADNKPHIKWVRVYSAKSFHSGSEGGYMNCEGGYMNFMSSDDDHRAAYNYGANYKRLCAVKAACDPDNLFHVDQNIAPANGR